MSSSLQVPNHIAVIMDGNGRWATKRNLSRLQGHKQGSETAKKFIEIALNYNIKNITLYAFSSENWRRSADEIDHMMYLMEYYLDSEISDLHKNNIRLKIIKKTIIIDNLKIAQFDFPIAMNFEDAFQIKCLMMKIIV